MSEVQFSQSRDFTAKGISREDMRKIVSVYGKDLEDIYTLGPGQRWILNAGIKNNSSFIMQMLFKADISLDLKEFRQKVCDVCRRQEALRFAYAYTELSKPYIVVLKNRTAELHFDDISSLSPKKQEDILARVGAADRKRGFDLEKDPLLRIKVYKLEESKHAFLFSMHHINADGTSVGLLMKEIFVDYVLNQDTVDLPWSFSYKNYAQHLESIDKEKELDFWRDYLKGIPEQDALPGENENHEGYQNDVETVLFSEDLLKKLQEAQKRFRTTQFNILAASWAVMMSRINGDEDVVFGIMSSGRAPGPGKNMMLAGGFALALPLRVRLNGVKRISQLFPEIQSGLINTMQHCYCSANELDEALERKKPVFSYILNCQNFMNGNEGQDMAFPGFQVLEVNLSGDMSYDLVACFTTTTEGYGIVFGYNSEAFARETIRLYADCFLKTLEAVVTDEDMRISDAPAFEQDIFKRTRNAALFSNLKKVLNLKKLSELKQLSDDDLIRLAKDVRIRLCRQGEKVFDIKDSTEDIIFVIRGKFEFWIERDDGWSIPISIQKDGDMLNMAAMFKDNRARYGAVTYSEEGELLYIPYKTFTWLLEEYPEISRWIIRKLLVSLDNAQHLWVNS